MAVIASLASGLLGTFSACLALAGGGTWAQFWLVYVVTSFGVFTVLLLFARHANRADAQLLEHEIAEELALVSPEGGKRVLASGRPLP